MLYEYLPILIPIAVVEIALGLTALVHVLKHPHYRFGNKLIWAFVVCLIQIIGPIFYFTCGRQKEAR